MRCVDCSLMWDVHWLLACVVHCVILMFVDVRYVLFVVCRVVYVVESVARGSSLLSVAASLPLAISCLLCNRWCFICVVVACCCLLVFILEFGCR